MNIANWISYLALFGPFFALIFFNSVIAYQLHSAFDASGPILGLIAEAPGFLGAAFWLLLAERVNVADRVYTSIERLQHPLDYVLGADGYSSAKWKRFVSAPATKFAMLDLPGEQENSNEFCKPRHGVALAFLDTFFLCLPAQTDFEIEVDYAAEAKNAWLTISDGADELILSFSESSSSETHSGTALLLNSHEERIKHLKLMLANAADGSYGIEPSDVAISNLSAQTVMGMSSLSYSAIVTNASDGEIFYATRCLYLGGNEKCFEINLFGEELCGERLKNFALKLSSSVVMKEGAFLGQFSAFH